MKSSPSWRHLLVSLAKSSPLIAVSGVPQTMPSAGLQTENIAPPKPLTISVESGPSPLTISGVSWLRDSTHSSHTTINFGGTLWSLTCMTHKSPAAFPIHAFYPASPSSCGSADRKVRLRAMTTGAAWSCMSGHSPVLRHGFPWAGTELPWLQGNTSLCGTQDCRKHALLAWSHPKRLTHSQSKIRV